jgi:MFS family permease
MALLQSLRHRPFALLWSGQTVSRLGDSLYRIALAWWVLEKTGSATAMGTVMIVSFVPMILFLLVGGVVVDRLHRLRVMVASDLLNGLIVSLVATLAYLNLLQLWHVYIAGAVFGLVEAFFYPAYTAAVPEMTPAEALPSANSLTSLSYQLTGIIGPGLGATLIALGGTSIAFALDAASFFIAVACLLPLIRAPSAPQAQRGATNPMRDLREGWKLVFGSAWLWISILVFAIFNVTAAGPMNVALPFLVKDSLHADVGLLGLLTSSRSAGSALGTIWTGRYARLRKRGWIMYLTTIVDGLAVLVVGLPIPLAGIVVAAFVNGMGLAIGNLIWVNTLQELVPREKLGRVSSIDAIGSFALMPVGFGVAGWLTDRIGPPLVFVFGGGLTAALAALPLLHRDIRNLD